jgi:hypothetical protein
LKLVKKVEIHFWFSQNIENTKRSKITIGSPEIFLSDIVTVLVVSFYCLHSNTHTMYKDFTEKNVLCEKYFLAFLVQLLIISML